MVGAEDGLSLEPNIIVLKNENQICEVHVLFHAPWPGLLECQHQGHPLGEFHGHPQHHHQILPRNNNKSSSN